MNLPPINIFKGSAEQRDAELRDFITPAARRKIRVSVIIGHAAMIFVPLLWMMFVNWLRPPKTIHKVNISMIETPYDLPSTGKSLGAPAPPPQEFAKEPEVPDEPPTPELPAPEPVKETPKVVEQPKPKPPEKKPTPVKKTVEKKKEPPKKEEKKEQPKEPPKKEAPKDTKKFVPLTPADIIKSKNAKLVKGPKGDPAAKPSKRVDPNSVFNDPNDKIVDNSSPVGNLFGGPSNAQLNDYYTSVSQYLYRMWQQPGKNLLAGSKPFVTLHMSVDASGRVVAARITKRSGVVVMDSSVDKLLTEVTVLPKPPKGAIEFDVTLKIDED